jgi:malonyl-CoA/methylmalonyl-CoA synthetase
MAEAAQPLFAWFDPARDDRPALRFGAQVLDYRSLRDACVTFGSVLSELGLSPGDRIAVWAHPELETAVGFIACMLAQATVVPLNPGLGEKELAHILADARPQAIFSAHPERDRERTPAVEVHGFTFERGAHSLPDTLPPAPPDAPLLIVYTSGTTGAPKGALLSASNVLATLDALADAWGISEEDTIVHALPLFHVHGLVFGLLGALRAGACLHWFSKFVPQEIARALSGQRRVLYAVPTMYHRLADAAEHDPSVQRGLASARLLVSGSAPLPAREHARIELLTGQRVCERYGLTETLINTAVRHDGDRRAGYVGPALPGVELRLVDDERRPIATRDDVTIGEVAVRGRNVFLGYLNRPEATAAVRDAEGWFYTGDLGTLSADGYLRIVGRKATDLIKTGGFKVGAGEVEGALLEHAGVREAAVLGAPDEDLGERIVAFVVAKDPDAPPSEAELAEHVAAQLAKHKRPRVIRFVGELPRNAMGKVQKSRLRELL